MGTWDELSGSYCQPLSLWSLWGSWSGEAELFEGGSVKSVHPKPLPLPLPELLMAKVWPQVGEFTFFSSLVTEAQMTPLGLPDLELGASKTSSQESSSIWGDTVKPNRRAVSALLL